MPESFVETCVDVLSSVGEVTARRMFGGHGLYHSGTMIALIADDVLYLKVDVESRAWFEEAGSSPFTFERRDGNRITMSYWEMPADGFESPGAAQLWAGRALSAALRAADS